MYPDIAKCPLGSRFPVWTFSVSPVKPLSCRSCTNFLRVNYRFVLLCSQLHHPQINAHLHRTKWTKKAIAQRKTSHCLVPPTKQKLSLASRKTELTLIHIPVSFGKEVSEWNSTDNTWDSEKGKQGPETKAVYISFTSNPIPSPIVVGQETQPSMGRRGTQ